MSKVPYAIVEPVLLTEIYNPVAVLRPGVTTVRNVHIINTSAGKVRLYLCKNGHDEATAWYWGRVLQPGEDLDWNTYKALREESDQIVAWADVPGALCLSVDGTVQPVE